MQDLLKILLYSFLVMAPLFLLALKKYGIRLRLLFVAIGAVCTFCIFIAVSIWTGDLSDWVYIYFLLEVLTVILCLLLILFSWIYDRRKLSEWRNKV